MTVARYTGRVGQQEIIFEIGQFAQQAGGAVMVRAGDSQLLVTATMNKTAREGIDFFPLSVDFEERMYAVGRIPGSFFRREGRPGERAILIARVTDRPLRPLFPKDLRNEVQVIVTPMSHDQENDLDMLSINGASAALMVSDVPWDGPVGAVRIGLIDGELVVNPTISQMASSDLDLRVAATSDAIIMVECSANEVPEETVLKALELAAESVQEVIALQRQMAQEIGKPKAEYKPAIVHEELQAQVEARVRGDIATIMRSKFDKDNRNEALDELRENVVAEYESLEDVAIDMKEVRDAISNTVKAQTRRQIIEEGVRPDGRQYTEIRPLSASVDLLPRVHGSGLFQRGETQVMSICTLGTPGDAQEIDDLYPVTAKRYMHHYNFPPFSTGETTFLRGPKRREIGHGALAEAALRPVIPPEKDFPYTIRVVSEVLSSNGSTSMASVCASTLSLMAAGVPIRRPVAGIAMGLIKEGDKIAVLTDIQGMEDHIGDMDFKVAGTTQGITALQMDIKIKGVSDQVMRQALAQAYDARMQILDVIAATIPEPRKDLSPYAPRMVILKISPEKIGTIIGPGGKIIRGIQEETKTKIEISEDGTTYIMGVISLGSDIERAKNTILGMTEEVEVGRIYTGKVQRIEPYGAFVNILPGQDGMLHISQLSNKRVNKVEDEVSIGDEITVMVTEIEHDGKIRLSRQAVMEGWTLEEAQSRDKGIANKRSGGGERRGGHGGGERRGGHGGGERRGDRDRDRRGDRDRRSDRDNY
ncbi:MAG: polyribonucleotide nucleotidyltransferase [Anaerolineae bacterium]|nr:polyribonucleotide nucleotidyltransferase [Anaerolineae bacterium]